ncbi:MAG: DUF3019 domain-containing protein [Shewanella sp.]
MIPLVVRLCYLLALTFALISCCTVYVQANEVASLKLTPEICITSEDNEACELRVELQWQQPHNELICIISDNSAYPKWCNDSLAQNSVSLNVSTSTDIHFVLVNKESNQTLAGAKLKITSTSTPQVRRRYRNPWSLF